MKVGSTATLSGTVYLIISHITFRDRRVHFFSDNLSRNSCILCEASLNFIRLLRVVITPSVRGRKRLEAIR